MARIDYVNYEQASQDVRAAYDAQLAHAGNVSNMKKTLLRSLPAYQALMQWYPLRDALQAVIGKRALAIFAHAISTENACLLCSTWFRRELTELGISPDQLQLSETESLLVDYARQIVKQPTHISHDLFAKLKKTYSEEDIVLLTAFATMMIATNLFNSVLNVELDSGLTSYVKKA